MIPIAFYRTLLSRLFGDEPEKEPQEAQEETPQQQDPGPPPPAPRELTLSQDHPVCQLWSIHAFTAKRLPQPRLCLTDPPDLPLDDQEAEKELARLQSAVTDSAGRRLALLDSGRASDLDAQVVVFTAAGGLAAWLLVYPPAGQGAEVSREMLDRALKEGKAVLLEGQLGTLKDPDHGIYPMVTSSSTLAAYGAIGAGIPPYEIGQVITVCKAYSSAVGAGAFVSEIFGDEADELRRRGGDGGEFGATTGRPRRMGWFDCVASRYGCRLQGTTDVAFTVLDVLGYLDEIPVCVGYEVDGTVTNEFPVTPVLEKAKPVLQSLPGWKADIRGIRRYEDLPENCRKYVEFIEEQIGYPITMVSNGPGREDIIYRESRL